LNDIDFELEERHRKEIWKLELDKEELLQKVYRLSQCLCKSSAEQIRSTQEGFRLTQELEQLKAEKHIQETQVRVIQEQHKQDMIELKKLLHACHIEKDQLLKQLKDMARQIQTARPERVGIPKRDSLHHDNIVPAPIPSSVLTQNCNFQMPTSKALIASIEQAKILQPMQVQISNEREELDQVDVPLRREAQELIKLSSNDNDISEIIMEEQRSKKINDLKSSASSLTSNTSADADALNHTNSGNGNLSIKSQAIALKEGQHRYDTAIQNTLSCTCVGENHIDNSINSVLIKRKDMCLIRVDLPAISNHEMLKYFSSSSNNNSKSTNQAKIHKIKYNPEHYGLFMKEPRNYAHKAQRNDNEKKKRDNHEPSPSAIISNLEGMVNMNHLSTHPVVEEETETLSFATAITRIMVGDWMWKYTRKLVGGGISEHRHRRFFWINPYTRTLYWSIHEPGTNGNQRSTKSGRCLLNSSKIVAYLYY
jgi:hypothetical protein